MYRYGIIGFGGLGKIHLSNLVEHAKKRGDFTLAAICGTTAEKAKKSISINLGTADVSSIDFSECNFYQDYKEMIDKENLDFAFSILPSYFHEEVALYALEKGVHLFSEKPMALTIDACKRMMEAAKKNNAKLMIGQCLRFHPAYIMLKKYIDDKTYGKVRRAEFYRYSQMPLWTWNNWILDCEKSGGAVIDFHVHDVDLINWYFGIPNSLHSAMTHMKIERESITTQFYYDDFIVVSQADWALPQTYPFKDGCQVDFDDASIRIEKDKLVIYTDKEIIEPKLEKNNSFYEEEGAFLKLVIDNVPCKNATIESVYDTMRIVMSEIESAKTKKTVEMII